MPIEVAGLIPHQGAMCLLDTVEGWNESSIVCRAESHRRTDHPLRDAAGLRGLCAIEYGAQAIAAHAGLLAGSPGAESGVGLLAAVRDVVVSVTRLDEIVEPLVIRADVLMRQDHGVIYEVAITAGGHTVLTGRLSVVLPQGRAGDSLSSESREGAQGRRG